MDPMGMSFSSFRISIKQRVSWNVTLECHSSDGRQVHACEVGLPSRRFAWLFWGRLQGKQRWGNRLMYRMWENNWRLWGNWTDIHIYVGLYIYGFAFEVHAARQLKHLCWSQIFFMYVFIQKYVHPDLACILFLFVYIYIKSFVHPDEWSFVHISFLKNLLLHLCFV